MNDKLSIEEAEILAQKFRVENGLSIGERFNGKSILLKNNIITVFRPLSSNFSGLSIRAKNGDRFILINSNLTRGRQHFTLAHELYHLYYDDNPEPHICKDTSDNNSEKNANMFASALLMPQSGLLPFISADEIASKNIRIATILRIEQYFSISRNSLLMRLKNIGLIKKDAYEQLSAIKVKESAKEYGYDLSLYNSGNENLVIGDFGEKAKLLFDSEKISEGHYQELLNMITNGED